jgi:hypothetical protein
MLRDILQDMCRDKFSPAPRLAECRLLGPPRMVLS